MRWGSACLDDETQDRPRVEASVPGDPVQEQSLEAACDRLYG
jgi:hypothetical protein